MYQLAFVTDCILQVRSSVFVQEYKIDFRKVPWESLLDPKGMNWESCLQMRSTAGHLGPSKPVWNTHVHKWVSENKKWNAALFTDGFTGGSWLQVCPSVQKFSRWSTSSSCPWLQISVTISYLPKTFLKYLHFKFLNYLNNNKISSILKDFFPRFLAFFFLLADTGDSFLRCSYFPAKEMVSLATGSRHWCYIPFSLLGTHHQNGKLFCVTKIFSSRWLTK